MDTIFIISDTVFTQGLQFIVQTREARLEEPRRLHEVTLENLGTRNKLLGLVGTSTAALREGSPQPGIICFLKQLK